MGLRPDASGFDSRLRHHDWPRRTSCHRNLRSCHSPYSGVYSSFLGQKLIARNNDSMLVKTLRPSANPAVLPVLAVCSLSSCTPGNQQLTPAMQEYRLSEVMKNLEQVNTTGLISSLSSDDSTLFVVISDEWQAAPIEQQKRALEVLGNSWVRVSAEIGVKEPLFGRLQVVAIDRWQRRHARWTAREKVQH